MASPATRRLADRPETSVLMMTTLAAATGGTTGVLSSLRLGVALAPLPKRLLGEPGRQLWLHLVAICLVVLIAWPNVTSLTSRQVEMTVHRAVAASSGHLGRQLFDKPTLLFVVVGGSGSRRAPTFSPVRCPCTSPGQPSGTERGAQRSPRTNTSR